MKAKNLKKEFNFQIDLHFVDYFRDRLKQVFLYVTDHCQLRCKQCLYKPNLMFQMKNGEIDLHTAIELISDFRKLGASKLTIMGGEPSLYGDSKHKQLMELIAKSKELGYEYVRMDTNGQYEDDFLNSEGIKKLDEVSFSLDGYTPKLHDLLRGKGTFEKCVANIKRTVDLGYNVDLTTCVHRKLIKRDKDGELALDKMIQFAEFLGVNRINFHVLFKHGFPMDTWTEETDIKWYEWVKIYKEINENIERGKYKILVRNPQHFTTKEEFQKHPAYYGYCAAKLGERVLVHPDGMIRICSGLIGSKYCVAKYYDHKIVCEKGLTNELTDHKLNIYTPCTNQSKSMECGDLLPLCFSFKPKQNEIVWQKKLNWESRKLIKPTKDMPFFKTP